VFYLLPVLFLIQLRFCALFNCEFLNKIKKETSKNEQKERKRENRRKTSEKREKQKRVL